LESAQLSNIYETLFTPLKIGPVTAPNRFYQVPHCTGMGHARSKADAAAPGLIADAVFDGHLAARNFGRDDGTVEKEFYIKEIISLE